MAVTHVNTQRWHETSPNRSTEIRDGIYWTQECLPLGSLNELERFERDQWLDADEGAHGCQNAYLLADDRTLLFGTRNRTATR